MAPIKLILIVLTFLFLLIESSLFPFPFLLIFSIILYLIDDSKIMLVYIFLLGLILDSLHVARFGLTPFFVFATLFIINLYKDKFEIKDYRFVVLIAAVSSILYAAIAGYAFNLPLDVLLFVSAIFLYLSFKKSKIL